MRKCLSVITFLFVGFISTAKSNGSDNSGFIENKGQWPSEVQFLYRTMGMNAWITNSGVVYDFYTIEKKADNFPNDRKKSILSGEYLETKAGHVMQMSLANANQAPHSEGFDGSLAVYNYLKGNEPGKWASSVVEYQEVVVSNVYPGIDIKYYVSGGKLRYDFLIDVDANPSEIAWDILGGNHRTENGEQLVLETSIGDVQMSELFAYQENNGLKAKVECSFVKGQDDLVRFDLGQYDKTKKLVIDPVVFATFLGGQYYEFPYGMEVNSAGEVFVIGETRSTDFPTTLGAYSNTNAGNEDCFVSKMAADGTTLIYSTYIGGDMRDLIIETPSILTADGGVIVTGTTMSSNFPTVVGAFDNTYNGDWDGFILKLNPAGTSLAFSTYLGGDLADFAQHAVLDNAGNIIVAGNTYAGDFPITGGAYDQTENGGGDLFIAKFNSDCSSLNFSTLFGGNDYDDCHAIELDENNNVIIAGETSSPDFPMVGSTYDQTYNGDGDLIVAKMNSTGSDVIWSTFVGGAAYEQCRGLLDIDDDYNIYISGITESADFPVTSGAYDNSLGGVADAFLLKMNPSGNGLIYSTYLGGALTDLSFGLTVDEHRTAYLCGKTTSTDFPTTTNAEQFVLRGGADQFVTRVNENGNGLIYSTYYGGDGIVFPPDPASVPDINEESSLSIWADDAGNVIFGGITWCATYPVTSGVYNEVIPFNTTENNTWFVATITKLQTCPEDFATAASNSPVCEGGDVLFFGSNGAIHNWTGPNSYTANEQYPHVYDATMQDAGTYTLTVTQYGCTSSAEVDVDIQPGLGTTIIGPATVDPLIPTSYVVSQNIGSTYDWSATNGGTIISGQGTNNVSFTFPNNGVSVITVTETGTDCTQTVTFEVTVGSIQPPDPPQWVLVNGDAIGDGADPSLMDGTQLEYLYDETTDSLFFRVTTSSIGGGQSQNVGVNVMVNIPGGGNTFNFWGSDNMDAWHKLVTTWVTGSAPSAYSGTIGIADATGVAGTDFTNLHQNNISIVVNPSASTIVLGMNRSDLISNAQMGSGIGVAAAVGSSMAWNDDIYLPGATITVAPQGIFGTEEIEQLSIYPNPSNGLFGLDLGGTEFTNSAQVLVLDNTGRAIFESTVIGSKMQIDLSEGSTGIYMIQVREDNLLGTSRIAVVK